MVTKLFFYIVLAVQTSVIDHSDIHNNVVCMAKIACEEYCLVGCNAM
jgi:hypothetical protein